MMGAVWFRARAEMRARWRAVLGLALIFGLIGGAAIAAAAGARRTMSAYPRFLDRFHDTDVAVNYPDVAQGLRAIAAMRALPQVTGISSDALFGGAIVTTDGRRTGFPNVFLTARVDDGPSVIKVLEGRMYDPADPTEVVITYLIAERLGLRAGDHVDVTLEPLFGEGPSVSIGRVAVVGVVAVPGSFESASGFAFPTVFSFPPAFYGAYRDRVAPAELHVGVGLRDGEAGAQRFFTLLQQMGFAPDSSETTSVFTPGVQALNRVPAMALWLLAAALGIASLAVVAQALTREAHGQGQDHLGLRAVGFTRAGLLLTAYLRALAVALAGAIVAMTVAVALSPLTPFGMARIAEPDPGIAVDLTALGLGAAVIIAGLLTAALPGMWRAVRASGRSERAASSAVVDGMARASVPVSIVAGVRFAMTPGGGRTRTPVRTAVLGTSLALAALIASLVFAQSLERLNNDSTLSGYTWDAGLIPTEGVPDALMEAVAPLPFVAEAWRGTVFEALGIAPPGGDALQLQTMADEGPPPTVIRGRPPSADDELALDLRTVRRFGLELGDEVLADRSSIYGGPAVPGKTFTLVGVAPITAFPFVGDNAGQGVVLTVEGARRADPKFVPESVFVRFKPGADFVRSVAELEALPRDLVFTVVTRNQASSVRNISRLGSLPPVLAALLGVLGLALLAHALTSTIQRRRADLAVLKTIGFIGRQLRAAVAWQASALVLLALLVGLPAGLVAGRWGWRLFAEHLSVVSVPVAPLWLFVLIPVATIAVANAIAAFPARAAARTQPALVFRSE